MPSGCSSNWVSTIDVCCLSRSLTPSPFCFRESSHLTHSPANTSIAASDSPLVDAAARPPSRAGARHAGAAALTTAARHGDPARSRYGGAGGAVHVELGVGAAAAGGPELAVEVVLGQAADASRVAVQAAAERAAGAAHG